MLVLNKNDDCFEEKSARRRGAFNPLILFLGVYVFYNLMGLLNTPWTISYSYDKSLGWRIFCTGLAGFSVGLAIFGWRPKKVVARQMKRRTSRQLSVLFFCLFSICLAFIIISSGGIPLFLGEERFGNSALAFNLAQLYGFWVLVVTISEFEAGRRPRVAPCIFYVVGASLMAYRTPALIFGVVILIYLVTFKLSKRQSIVAAAISSVAFVGFAAGFAAYRVSQNYDIESFFSNIDFSYIGEHKYLMPLVPALSMFDYSQNTIHDIGGSLRDNMYGGLLLSNYETLLPGKHWGARNIIGNLVKARWVAGRPMSITPTLQGALYVDFGYLGVFFGLAFIAAGIGWLWKMSTVWGGVGKFSFCYITALSIMSIHNGYWDVGFVFFLFFLALLRAFDFLRITHPPRSLARFSAK